MASLEVTTDSDAPQASPKTAALYRMVAFRKNLYETIEQLQTDLDQWLHHFNTLRKQQGKCVAEEHPSRP